MCQWCSWEFYNDCIGFKTENKILFQWQQNILTDDSKKDFSLFMWPCGCYGNNQVVVKDNKSESKVTANNAKAENFLHIKIH